MKVLVSPGELDDDFAPKLVTKKRSAHYLYNKLYIKIVCDILEAS